MRTPLGLLAAAAFLVPGPTGEPEAPLPASRDSTLVLPDSVQALLTVPMSLRVASDQSFYVTDARQPFVLHLDRRGQLIGKVGRQGSGPGEFARPTLLGWRGDSLWVDDQGLLRLTLFSLDQGGVTTISQYLTRRGGDGGPVRYATGAATLGLLADGDLVVYRYPYESEREAGAAAVILRVGRDYSIRDTLARLEIRRPLITLTFASGGAVTQPQPFSDDPMADVSANGRWLVRVDRPAATASGAAQFRVSLTEIGQRPTYDRVITYHPLPLDQDSVSRTVQAMARRGRGGPGTVFPATADSIERKLYRPRYFPPVSDLRVAQDGTVWLRLTELESRPAIGKGLVTWVALSPRGFEMARLTVPAGFRARDVEARRLWGLETDQDGVPTVVRYLVPAPGKVVAERPG